MASVHGSSGMVAERAIVESATEEPLATVVVDSDTFIVLATGRQAASAVAARIGLSGDQALGQRVVDNLNMMI